MYTSKSTRKIFCLCVFFLIVVYLVVSLRQHGWCQILFWKAMWLVSYTICASGVIFLFVRYSRVQRNILEKNNFFWKKNIAISQTFNQNLSSGLSILHSASSFERFDVFFKRVNLFTPNWQDSEKIIDLLR